MNYKWNWAIFWEPSPYGESANSYFQLLMNGLSVTLATAIAAAILALALGIAGGVALTVPNRWARRCTNAYIELFRNVPLLVQFFMWFFVLPELLPVFAGDWLKALPNAPFLTAVVCLGVFHSARVAVMLASGIGSLPPGQSQAGSALGLTQPQLYRWILLPMAFRVALPPLASESINIVKNSAIGLTVGLLELTASTRAMSEFTFHTFEAFTAATLIYFAVNLVVLTLMRRAEKLAAIPGQSPQITEVRNAR